MVGKIAHALLLFGVSLALAVSVFTQCVTSSFDAGILVDSGVGGATGEIVSGDLNSDGRVDIVVPHFGVNTVAVLLGNAMGPPTVVPLTIQGPGAVGIADFNHDGKLDLVISHGNINTLFVAIMLGDGAGGFGSPTDFPVTLYQPLVVADFNNDGNPDVFLGNSSTGVSQMLLGNGSGGLAAPFQVVLTNNTKAVAADFNNDGKMDLAMQYDGSDPVKVALGDGTGHFGSVASFPGSYSLSGSIAAGDLNSDGKLDLVSSGQADGFSVLLGDGVGGFGPANSISTGFSTIGIAIGDFNGDGKTDVATTSGNLIQISLGNGNGGFISTTNYPVSQSPVNVVVGDFNGDNKLDLGTGSCPNCITAPTIFFGDGNGKLLFPSIINGSTSTIINGDVNGDGKLDLVIGNTGQNDSLLLGDGSGGFAASTNIPVGIPATPVALNDLNGDGNLDLVTASSSSNAISIVFGNGNGFAAPLVRSVPGFNPKTVSIGDFNNDGKPDLAVAYLNSNFVSILLANGTGGFGAATNFTVPFGAQQIAVNDLNRDGKADLAVGTISGVSVLLGNGSGAFGAANTFATPATALSVAVGDFNSDGKADLAATIINNNVILVYLGDGQGNFGSPASLKSGGANSLVVGDFNADGNSDLATANGSGTISVLLGNGLGGFASAITYLTGGFNTISLTSGDFNSDGHPDLAAANFGAAFAIPKPNNVSVLINRCPAPPLSQPILSINDVTLTEGDSGISSATFSVNLSAPSSKTVSVSFYSAPQDATKDVDYQTTLGRITFEPGTTSKTITVQIIGDTLDEFDEQFSVLLAYPLNANVSKGGGNGTILDNDPPPNVSISDISVLEGNSGTTSAIFTVILSTASGKPISVEYVTADGTATSGSDYVSKSGNVMVLPGAISSTIAIQVNGDTMVESDETFLVNLTGVVNAMIGRGQGVATILNDDSAMQLSSATYTVNEDTPRVDINLARTGDLTSAVSVKFTTNDAAGLTNCNVLNTGIASPRCDYINTLGTMSFAAGEYSKSFSVAIIDDSYAEGNESFTVSLTGVSGATLGAQSTATITIVDNDTVRDQHLHRRYDAVRPHTCLATVLPVS